MSKPSADVRVPFMEELGKILFRITHDAVEAIRDSCKAFEAQIFQTSADAEQYRAAFSAKLADLNKLPTARVDYVAANVPKFFDEVLAAPPQLTPAQLQYIARLEVERQNIHMLESFVMWSEDAAMVQRYNSAIEFLRADPLAPKSLHSALDMQLFERIQEMVQNVKAFHHLKAAEAFQEFAVDSDRVEGGGLFHQKFQELLVAVAANPAAEFPGLKTAFAEWQAQKEADSCPDLNAVAESLGDPGQATAGPVKWWAS